MLRMLSAGSCCQLPPLRGADGTNRETPSAASLPAGWSTATPPSANCEPLPGAANTVSVSPVSVSPVSRARRDDNDGAFYRRMAGPLPRHLGVLAAVVGRSTRRSVYIAARPASMRLRLQLAWICRLCRRRLRVAAEWFCPSTGPRLHLGYIVQILPPTALREGTGRWCLLALISQSQFAEGWPETSPLRLQAALYLQGRLERLRLHGFHVLLIRADDSVWRSVAARSTWTLVPRLLPHEAGRSSWSIRYFPEVPGGDSQRRPSDEHAQA